MSEMTKCDGKNCKMKGQCQRYTSVPYRHDQMYFTLSPLDDKGDCDEFLDNGKKLPVKRRL